MIATWCFVVSIIVLDEVWCIVATYNLLYNASLLVKAGVGIALAFNGIITHPELTFVPLTDAVVSPLYLIWKGETVTSNMRIFIEELQSHLENSPN